MTATDELPHFWTADGTLHVEPRKLPERIDVTLPDERGREVRSARVRRYVAERTCHKKRGKGDYLFCSECGFNITGGWAHFCPSCGAKVVDLREKSQEDE